uniref:Choline/carnitine acyltransferase domain-containing protein n=1 Tax=Glossina brevipalpis TaxID=37001 RepID=A0A1A9W5I6_9MUSC
MFKSERSTERNLNQSELLFAPEDNMQLLSNLILSKLLAKNVCRRISTNLCASSVIRRDFSQEKEKSEKKQKLLRYPALKLDKTMEKFLKSCEPLLTTEEMEKTKKVAQKFVCNEGKKLQELLEKAACKEENWLANRWLKAAYMQYRDPVSVWSSPGMTFPMKLFVQDEEWLKYTAKAIMGMIKYKKKVDCGEVPVVKMGKNELDNSQFKVVYGTCRIPQPKEDIMDYNPDSKYVVIIHKNHFFKLPVYNKNGEILNAEILEGELVRLTLSETERGIPYGVLTTNQRDDWADAYAELLKSQKNAESIKIIQKSLFTVSLDGCTVAYKDTVLADRALQLIHGGNVCRNGANRWMDKTIQLIVNPNGMSGFCYEHSPAEGQPIAQIAEYLSKIMPKEEEFKTGSSKDFESYTKLEFDKPTECTLSQIEEASSNLNALVKNFQLHVIQFKNYGKGLLKKHKLSPDSFIQMALQYAFYRLHKKPAAQYETAHLRIFYNGRTETIRSCSNESVAFAKGMLDEKLDDKQRAELLRKAVEGHRKYTTMALTGEGIDRHLLGLKLMAFENQIPTPEFYNSPGYIKSMHFRVSTSQVASKDDAYMCYGPMFDDGYSCCYNPREDDIFIGVGAWHSNKETCAIKYSKSIEEALLYMKKVLEAQTDADKKPPPAKAGADKKKPPAKADADKKPKSKL